MIAIESIASDALLACAKACFYGQFKGSTETPLKPHETPEKGIGVSGKTQCPCGFAGDETPETPETCQKTEVDVQTAKKEPKMGVNGVAEWAKKRLAEGARWSAPAPAPASAPAPAMAPLPPPLEPAPAPASAPLSAAQAGPPAPAPAPPPAPMPWLSVHQPWRAADRLYEAHHWQCPACRAAARGRYTERCVEGQRLHDAYTLASSAALNESNP